MTAHSYLTREAKAFVKRTKGPDEVVRAFPTVFTWEPCYRLYTAFDEDPEYLGCILFDAQGYWIYDGDSLPVGEQEQLADFIINYVEHL